MSLICPRVVKVDNKTQTTFSVKVCNISAKAYTIKPKSDFCQLNEVKVVDNWVPDNENKSDNSNSSSLEDMGVTINDSDLSEAQLLRVRQVLGKWKHVFSTGPNDIGNTDLVKHKIVLDDDKTFKQPYRRRFVRGSKTTCQGNVRQ